MFSTWRNKNLTKPVLRLFYYIPCIDKNGKPLNPVNVEKAILGVSKNKSKLKVDGVLGYYLKLNDEIKEENFKRHPLILGIDLGKYYDGYTLLNKNFNFNLQDNSLEKEVKNIKNKTKRKNKYKRIRRGRLHHRRWNPKENKERIQYTLNYYLQKRMFIIEKFIKYFPITDIVIERVNHFPNSNNGSNFSMLETSQSKIVKYLESRYPNISITNTINGFTTKYERENYFETSKIQLTEEQKKAIDFISNITSYKIAKESFEELYYGKKSIKNRDKSIENFYSHCVDSFIQSYIVLRDKYNIEFNKSKLNTNIIIKQQLKVLERRHLSKLLTESKDKKFYKKIKKRGKIVNRKNHTNGKIYKIRYKSFNTNNNHINNWEYRYQEPVIKEHKYINKNYGGTIIKTKNSREYSKTKNNLGKSKRWIRNNIYKNYEIKIINC